MDVAGRRTERDDRLPRRREWSAHRDPDEFAAHGSGEQVVRVPSQPCREPREQGDRFDGGSAGEHRLLHQPPVATGSE